MSSTAIGEEAEVTVMFVDIRDFTPFAEGASAREAVTRLNDFFGLVVPIIAKHGGHANKFVGDGVMAVFGAPEHMPDHADRAIEAACELADAVEAKFGDELAIGIGLNSGPVVAGVIGWGSGATAGSANTMAATFCCNSSSDPTDS